MELIAVIELTHPGMLLVAVAAVIPLLIHYLYRRILVRMNWAATGFLRLALKKTLRRLWMINWLLLALRTAMVILLAICLTVPEFGRGWDEAHSGQEPVQELHFILIDNSFSMSAVETDRSRLDRARQIATRIVQDADPTDAFTVYAATDRLDPLIELPVSDRKQVLARIDGLRGTARAGRAADLIESLVEICNRLHDQDFDRLVLHWISDFPAVDWDDDARSRLTRLGEQFPWLRVKTWVCRQAEVRNRAIVSLQADSVRAIAPATVLVRVEIREFGPMGDEPAVVELLADGKVIARRDVPVSADGTGSVSVPIPLDQPGSYQIEARIGPDPVELDNRRYLFVDVRSRYRLLFVEGRKVCSRFLRLALQPVSTGRARFHLEVCSPAGLQRKTLSDFDGIVLDNLQQLDPASVARVRQFVSSGGFALLIPGDQTDRSLFNRRWNPPDGKPLGIQLVGRQPVDVYPIDPLDYTSPFLQAFRGNPDSGLTSLPIWSYFRVAVDPQSGFRTDLAVGQRDPLILSRREDRGMWVVMTTASSSDSRVRGPVRTPFNAIELSPAFPPLVHELVTRGISQPVNRSFPVGAMASGSLELRTRATDISVSDRSGQVYDVLVTHENDLLSWRTEAIEFAGFYRFAGRTQTTTFEQGFVVNVDPVESDLRPAEDFPGEPVVPRTGQPPGRYRGAAVDLYHWLILALLVCVSAEFIAGYRLGRNHG